MAHVIKLSNHEEAYIASQRSVEGTKYSIGDIVNYDMLSGTYSKVPPPTVPVANLNGTSREELGEQYHAALNALSAAISAHNRSAPHGRDYQTVHPEVYRSARNEFKSRAERLEMVRAELESILFTIMK